MALPLFGRDEPTPDGDGGDRVTLPVDLRAYAKLVQTGQDADAFGDQEAKTSPILFGESPDVSGAVTVAIAAVASPTTDSTPPSAGADPAAVPRPKGPPWMSERTSNSLREPAVPPPRTSEVQLVKPAVIAPLPSLNHVPFVAIEEDDIVWYDFNEAVLRVIAAIDGHRSVEAVVAAVAAVETMEQRESFERRTPSPRPDVVNVLGELTLAGVIGFR